MTSQHSKSPKNQESHKSLRGCSTGDAAAWLLRPRSLSIHDHSCWTSPDRSEGVGEGANTVGGGKPRITEAPSRAKQS